MTSKTTVIRLPATLLAALSLAACSGGPSPLPSLSTGSVSATAPATPVDPVQAAAQAEAESRGTYTSRAFQVGSTSARAVKCGFNFDPARLRQQFMAAEATSGTAAADMEKVEKLYDISFNGISRGIADKQDYCSDAKSKEIKEDLTRHLAGDYKPRPQKKVAQDSGGLFGGIFDASGDVDNGPKIGTTDWWEKQNEKMGR
ncbi:MAG: hypothetical protein AB7E80_03660 [Hyphomicrobiaceae bacterium]